MALSGSTTKRSTPPHAARPERASSAKRARAAAPAGPQIRIMFRKAIAMGPGKADLLRAIERTGSISAAARELGMSYRRAWLLVDTMNQCFQSPLVETLTGGQHGGGARVTEVGHDVLRRYLEMEAKAARSVQKELSEFARLMALAPKA
jgi:molybdate transport system regulatory protein